MPPVFCSLRRCLARAAACWRPGVIAGPRTAFMRLPRPVTGWEAAQVRTAEAVQRHCRLRGVAPSLVPQAPVAGSPSERLAFAKGEQTCGQQGDTRVREAWSALLR